MHKKKMSAWKKWGIGLALGLVLFFLGGYLFTLWLRVSLPDVTGKEIPLEVVRHSDTNFSANNCQLRLSSSGLWEMYLEGDGYQRGLAAGKMCEPLLKYQEDVFVSQIRKMVPSDNYLMVLRNFIAFFNRNLTENIPEEYLEEIYGISLSCTHAYDFVGTPYERQLNYHAAHDLGHAMQDYMLVGCTSFAGWGDATEDSTLLIGRNFDFHVGDEFARNKIVAFYRPEKGYAFASVTWAGMTGVLSGMNEKGLTVTINAAKSKMPTSSATPISILCREILQYASTIDEAYAIAQKRKIFVSESILIGSAIDNKAVIIEKSPEKTGLYVSKGNWLTCANHYQSAVFKNEIENLENIRVSDSPYRQMRTDQLVASSLPLNPEKAASILRNKEGLGDKPIGLGNEKAINQLICHHSVIFAPQKGLMWVSTAPWQLGAYVAYDLKKIFANPDFSSEIQTEGLRIAEDPFLQTREYNQYLSYRSETISLKKSIEGKEALEEKKIAGYIETNPELYYVYELSGDYYASQKNYVQARSYWEKALEKEIPRLTEKEKITKKIQEHP